MTALILTSAPITTTTTTPSPALVYLRRLAASRRRSQLHALNTMASILSNGVYDAVDLPWAQT